MQPSDGQNWSHGSEASTIGTKEWADYVRLQLVAMVDHLGENEESFLGFIELAREHRAWTLMTKKDGTTFKTIEEFCGYRRPWGLGTTWGQLRPHLVSGMAKRGKTVDEIERSLQLETVPEPKQGERVDVTSSHDDTKLPPRATVARLRAINRAPDAVKDAYREGRISQTLAAKLGPKNPTPEQAAVIAEIAQTVRKVTDRKQVDRTVRERLGTRSAGAPARAMGIVKRMSREDLYSFENLFNEFLQAGRS